MKNINRELTDKLFDAILQLGSKDECYKFFDDLCTIKEVQDISQRLEVARLLSEGLSYTEVAAKTGASTATISRVNRCLSYGSGGYGFILERTKKKTDVK